MEIKLTTNNYGDDRHWRNSRSWQSFRLVPHEPAPKISDLITFLNIVLCGKISTRLFTNRYSKLLQFVGTVTII